MLLLVTDGMLVYNPSFAYSFTILIGSGIQLPNHGNAMGVTVTVVTQTYMCEYSSCQIDAKIGCSQSQMIHWAWYLHDS